MKILHLHVKREYFDQIASGEKIEEFRLYNEYWRKRILFREYAGIILYAGYPRKHDPSRRLERLWRGWTIKEITHPHFGKRSVIVFAIRVNP